jgi:hypothetical protein
MPSTHIHHGAAPRSLPVCFPRWIGRSLAPTWSRRRSTETHDEAEGEGHPHTGERRCAGRRAPGGGAGPRLVSGRSFHRRAAQRHGRMVQTVHTAVILVWSDVSYRDKSRIEHREAKIKHTMSF